MKTDIKARTTNIEKRETNMNPSQEQPTNEEFLEGELSEEELNIIAAGLGSGLFVGISGSGGVDLNIDLNL